MSILSGCNGVSSKSEFRLMPLIKKVVDEAWEIAENNEDPFEGIGIASSVPLKYYPCLEFVAISETSSPKEPLSQKEQAYAKDLTNNILSKINMKLSLNNIVSDVRGFALTPKILRAALKILIERNQKEKVLSLCQLNALVTTLEKTTKETKEIIPPIYKETVSILVNQNGYAINSPVPLLIVHPEDDAVAKIVITNQQGEKIQIFDSNKMSQKKLEVHYHNLKGYKKAFVKIVLLPLPQGKYILTLTTSKATQISQEFEVKPNVYSKALAYSKSFFKVQRAHDPQKKFHGGVYADDPVNIGGHLDAGDNNTYLYTEAPTMLNLIYAYQVSGDRDFLLEAEYGAKFLAGLVKKDGSMWSAIFNGYPPYSPSSETDGIPNTGDERPLKDKLWGPTEWAEAAAAAVFAKCTLYKIDKYEEYLAKAKLVGERLMKNYAQNISAGDFGNNLQGFGALISYNLTLYKITKEKKYLKRIENLASQILKNQTPQGYFASGGRVAFQDYVPHLFIEALNELYQFYTENKMAKEAKPIKRSLLRFAKHLLELADPIYGRSLFLVNNPSGGISIRPSVPLQDWMTGTHRGANSYIISTANALTIAYQLSGNVKYLRSAQDQMSWLFGTNPYKTSMLTGIGKNADEYHTRLKHDKVYRKKFPACAKGGAVLGGIINGIGERWGIPFLDLNPFPGEHPSWQTTEVWVPHVGWFALAASRLNREIPELPAPRKEIERILRRSWEHYKKFMIDKDGRPFCGPDKMDKYTKDIDGDKNTTELITVSEGVSYVLLRARAIKDKEAFDKTWKWARENLQRKNIKKIYFWNKGKWVEPHIKDHLFAWRWVPTLKGKKGGVIHYEYIKGDIWRSCFDAAADADIDIAVSLILAYKEWKDPSYLAEARPILNDIWKKFVKKVGNHYYLFGGDQFRNMGEINPSYMRPSYYKLFAEVDPRHPWQELTKTSFRVIVESGDITLHDEKGKVIPGKVNLPSNWIDIQPDESLTDSDIFLRQGGHLFGWDAFRTLFWVAQDNALFANPASQKYLTDNSCTTADFGPYCFLKKEIARKGKIMGGFTRDGKVAPRSDRYWGRYLNREQFAMYGVYLPYFFFAGDKKATDKIYTRLQRIYNRKGYWGKNRREYYGQNWAWFGLALILGKGMHLMGRSTTIRAASSSTPKDLNKSE